MKKLLFLFIFLSILMGLYSSAYPATNFIHNWNLNKWYTNKTINQALSNAAKGHVIDVYPGTYKESVLISLKTNLTLQAYSLTNSHHNRTNTIIYASNLNMGVKITNSMRITFKGFTVRNALQHGIYVTGNSMSNYIGYNISCSNMDRGIALWGDAGQSVDYNSVISNRSYGNNDGIRLENARHNLCKGNRCTGNFRTGVDSEGFILSASFFMTTASNLISGNYILSNTGSGLKVNNPLAMNNIITNNDVEACVNGIMIQQGSGNRIKNNTIKHCTNMAISLNTPHNHTFYNSVFSNIGPCGIYLTNSSFSTNIGNIVYENKKGIYADFATNSVFISNRTHHNKSDGISADRSTNILLIGNICYQNETNGIHLLAQGGANINGGDVINNTVYSNTQNGIYLQGDQLDRVLVMSNKIYKNSSKGILIQAGDNNRIFCNPLISGSTNGVYISLGSTTTTVSNNYIVNCSGNGLFAAEGQNLKIVLNTIVSNMNGFVYARNNNNRDFTRNNIYNNFHLNYTNLWTPWTLVFLTNNWWGTTVASTIGSKIDDRSPYDSFIPYRLFGPFDITPGADTIPPSNITAITCQIIFGPGIRLSWNNCAGAVRYFIYRTNVNVWSNLGRKNVKGTTPTTSWTDWNPCNGTNYYFITALDGPLFPFGSPYTNETWYSRSTNAVVDTIPPSSIRLIMPRSNCLTNSKNIFFKWHKSTDSVSGVSNYTAMFTNSAAAWGTNIIKSWVETNCVLNFLPEGTNWWYVRAQDRAGNLSVISNTWKLRIDVTPPAITLSSPASNSTLASGWVQFQWSISDNLSGLSNQRVMIDTNNDGLFEITKYTNPPCSFLLLHSSTNKWKVWARDRAGNTNNSPVWKIVINTNKPIVTLYQPLMIYTNVNTPTFTWSCKSNNGAISNIIEIDTVSNFISAGKRVMNGGTAFTNWTVSPSLGTNKYYWHVRTYKPAMVTWYTSSRSWVWVDTNHPSPATLTSPPDNSIYTNRSSSISLSWAVSFDIGSGISNYTYVISNSTTGVRNNPTINGTIAAYTTSTEGNYIWYVISHDRAKNASYSGAWHFTVDTNMPTRVALVAPAPNKTTNTNYIQFVWKRSADNISGISNYELQSSTNNFLSFTFIGQTTNTNQIVPSLSGRTNLWRVRAWDRANHGGVWSVTNRLIILPSDSQPPSPVRLIMPSSNFLTNAPAINFVWHRSTDLQSGLSNYQIKVTNNSPSWSTNLVKNKNVTNQLINNVREGTNWWYVRAMDRGGNLSVVSNIWKLRIDITPPAINLIQPPDSSVLPSGSVQFQWSASDNISGISNQRIMIDTNNDAIYEITKSTNPPWSRFLLHSSTNKWKVWARDRAGNTNNSSVWRIVINTNKPIAGLYQPLMIFTNSSSIPFSWSAESQNGAISNILQISTLYDFSSGNQFFKGGVNYTNAGPVSLSTAKYYWRVITYKGSMTTYYTSGASWVWVDTNHPSPVNLIYPPNQSIFSNNFTVNPLILSWNRGSDIGSGITNYQSRISNISGFPITTSGYQPETNVSFYPLCDGIYDWWVWSFDHAGNMTISALRRFILDSTNFPQRVGLVAPVNDKTTNTNNILFLWKRSVDLVSGISNYQMQASTNGFISFTVNTITASTSLAVINLSGRTNLWRVRAMDRANHFSPWSMTNRLIISIGDSVKPYFANISPTDGALDVATNANILFQVFDNVAVSSQSLVVRINQILALTNGNEKFGFTISMRRTNTGFSVRVDPNSPFGSFSWVTNFISGRDTHNNLVLTNFIFRTKDTVSPFITGTVPANNDMNVAVQTNILIRFSETMDRRSTNSFSIRAGSYASLEGTFSFLSASRTDDVMVFDPQYYLPNNTWFTVSISTNAHDINGNRLMKGTNVIFQTKAETSPLMIIDHAPKDGATNVPANATIKITFGANMDTTTASTSALVLRPESAGSFSWGGLYFVKDSLLFQPSLPFSFLTTYTCTITTNLRSIYGNRISANSNFVFRIQQDNIPPDNVAFLRATVQTSNILLEWQNPPDADFKGTVIYYRIDNRYPAFPGDGTLLCDRTNLAGSFDSALHQGVVLGVTYYYTAFTYDRTIPANYSIPVDRARTRAILGAIIDVLDVRPNKLVLSQDSFVDFMVKLPEPGDINIEIFNMAGERVKKINPGTHQQFTYRWYGSKADTQENMYPKMAPGAYLAVFRNNKVNKVIKVFYIVK